MFFSMLFQTLLNPRQQLAVVVVVVRNTRLQAIHKHSKLWLVLRPPLPSMLLVRHSSRGLPARLGFQARRRRDFIMPISRVLPRRL